MSKRLALLFLLGACADRSLGTGEDPQDPKKIDDPVIGCDGSAPYCVDFCGSDWLQAQATCKNDDWVCPAPLRRIDQCPPNTCWGPPASDAEICGPSGWECHPTMNDFETCPDFLCPECTGFEGPAKVGECTCDCTNVSGQDQVRCTRSFSAIDPSARFFFSYVGGAVASGGGVEIFGNGTVHGWFASGGVTSGPPDFSGTLPANDVAKLFGLYHAVDTSSLPHSAGGAECYVHGGIKDCAACTEKTFDYSVAKQLLPEMSPVWSWFDDHAKDSIGVADFSPAQFCNF
jgi:hypothetical protein